jgi:hypothetical protein
MSPARLFLRGAGAEFHPLDRGPVDFIERDHITGAIIEFRRPRAFMRGRSCAFSNMLPASK